MGEWLTDNWFNIYMVGALIVAGLTWLAAFFGLWWFAGAKYGLWGMMLGWLPGGVAGTVGAVVIGALWPLAVPAFLWLAGTMLEQY